MKSQVKGSRELQEEKIWIFKFRSNCKPKANILCPENMTLSIKINQKSIEIYVC
jgi:hypothetical protein